MDAVLRWALAAVLLALAGYHLARLVRRGPGPSRDVDVVHAAMAVVMALLLVAAAGPTAGWLLAVAFVAATLWFGVRSLDPTYGRASGNLRQSACCAAMVAMIVIPLSAPGAMGGMPGMGPSAPAHSPLLVLLAVQAGLILWTGAEVTRTGAAARTHVGAQLATITGGAGMVSLMLLTP